MSKAKSKNYVSLQFPRQTLLFLPILNFFFFFFGGGGLLLKVILHSTTQHNNNKKFPPIYWPFLFPPAMYLKQTYFLLWPKNDLVQTVMYRQARLIGGQRKCTDMQHQQNTPLNSQHVVCCKLWQPVYDSQSEGGYGLLAVWTMD